jgi:hypoxanthine phosphoribosyltransferase
MRKRIYPYSEFEVHIWNITLDIYKSQKKYNKIIGISRGGLIPGVVLSHRLNIPFMPLQWSKTEQDRSMSVETFKDALLVDDIIDDGTTMKEIFEHYCPCDTAVLIYNEINKCNIEPTYHGWKINRNEMPEWFDFWWERV